MTLCRPPGPCPPLAFSLPTSCPLPPSTSRPSRSFALHPCPLDQTQRTHLPLRRTTKDRRLPLIPRLSRQVRSLAPPLAPPLPTSPTFTWFPTSAPLPSPSSPSRRLPSPDLNSSPSSLSCPSASLLPNCRRASLRTPPPHLRRRLLNVNPTRLPLVWRVRLELVKRRWHALPCRKEDWRGLLWRHL
jgi:hypothetical protein